MPGDLERYAGTNSFSSLVDGLSDEPASALLLVGPEGDFSDEEKALMKASSFRAVGLGPTRLRTETAAIAFLAIVQEAFRRRFNSESPESIRRSESQLT